MAGRSVCPANEAETGNALKSVPSDDMRVRWDTLRTGLLRQPSTEKLDKVQPPLCRLKNDAYKRMRHSIVIPPEKGCYSPA